VYCEASKLDNKCRRNCLSIRPACCISHRPLRGRIKHKFLRHAVSAGCNWTPPSSCSQLNGCTWMSHYSCI